MTFTIFVLASNALTAHAAFIIQPVGATATSDNSGARPAVATTDGSGLSSALSTGDAIPGIYPDHDTVATGMWAASSGDAAPSITFDLGAVFAIEGFHVWNFNQAGFSDVGARSVSISFSTTSPTLGFGGTESFLGANEFAQGPESASYSGEDKLFGTVHTAQWVRFDVLTNWGNATFLGALSEVRFFEFEAPQVPEPSTLVLLGLGMVGLGVRRRRSVAIRG